MADNMNMEITDEMMDEVVGGKIGELDHPKFTIGEIVKVAFKDGETTNVLEGPIIGVVASPVCWWYTVELESNGKYYKVKLPEDGLLAHNPR